MTVTFWKTFSKRRNSTLVPSTAGVELTCYLKDDTSMHDPVLRLQTSEFGYEYAKIAWGTGGPEKYYFVVDVVSINNNIVEYHLTEDSMATNKTAIGATSAHIVYSSTGYDPMIIDSRIQVLNSRRRVAKIKPNSEVFTGPGGYILTVYNNIAASNNSSGFAMSYFLNENAMGTVREWFADDDVYAAFADYFEGDPLGAIFNCIWVPYNCSGVGTMTNVVNIGNRTNTQDHFDFGPNAECYVINGFPTIDGTVDFAMHANYSDFRMAEPYTTGQVFLPGVGNVDICMGDWIHTTTLYVKYRIEVCTGNIKYCLLPGSNSAFVIQSFDCNVAANCPLGKVSNNGAGIMTGIGATVGGLASLAVGIASHGATLAVSGGLAAIAGAASTALANNKHGTSISGSFGARGASYYPDIVYSEYAVETEDPDSATYIALKGRPYGGTVATISSLSGYVECEGASVGGSMSAKEKEEINTYLNSGFYWE